MTTAPTLDDLFAVMSSALYGDAAARVVIPEAPSVDDPATRLGIALNVLLDDLSSRARAAERMRDRLAILAEAAREFSAATRDPDRLLDTVARRIAEVLKDQCVVRLLSEDPGEFALVGVHDVDPQVERITRETLSAPAQLRTPPVLRRVHESGEPLLIEKVDEEWLRASVPPPFFEYLRGIGLHSVMVVPLRYDGRTLGHLRLARHRPGSPAYDQHDLGLTCALADHAALSIVNARSLVAERAARAAAERTKDELQASEARYRQMFDSSPLPSWIYDRETYQFVAVNDAAVRHYGYSREEFLAMKASDIRPPEDVARFRAAVPPQNAGVEIGEWRHLKKSGELMLVEITTHALTLDGRPCRLSVGKDVTERTRLEEQLRQSQKMEAVGRLAGGVAHDFNNVLTVILGYSDTLVRQMKAGEPMREDLEEILAAGKRAAELTRQLLMFSRKQVLEPRVVDLNGVLHRMDRMFQRILGADVDLVSLPAASLGSIRVDPGSLEQVIMNLVINARDAMPTGGKLTIETANVVLDDAYARGHVGAKPGRHVMLAVTDTGTGIDPATLTRIFEPFFTTKAAGKGTGLGLSTVFGIVQQSGGSVWVYSEPGKGTTFKVYLPRVDAAVDPASPSQPLLTTLRGSETILLVEDDEQVRTMVQRILVGQGYHVIAASNGGEALLHAEQHRGAIDLLLSDVVMPQMSGPELATRLARSRPAMKVLCMSGYTDDSIVRHGVVERRLCFIQKPVTPDALASKVREVLGGAS